MSSTSYFACTAFLAFLIVSELDRKAVSRPFDDHYFRTHWLSAPINLFLRSQMHFSLREKVIAPINRKTFPNVALIRQAFSVIKEEALAAYAQSTQINKDLFFWRIADRGWKRFYLKWYGPPDPEAQRVCPRTVALLKGMPNVHLAMFSILEPGSLIKPHSGPFRGCYRYHMGILTPNDDRCHIKIGGEKYSWRDGEDVLFDDTFYHEVRNDTDKVRIVLFMDVQRPMRTRAGNAANDWFIKNIVPLSTRANDRQEAKSLVRAGAGKVA